MTVVTLQALGHDTLVSAGVKVHNISHHVFVDDVDGVVQNVLMISFPLNFLFESRLELLISIRLVNLM